MRDPEGKEDEVVSGRRLPTKDVGYHVVDVTGLDALPVELGAKRSVLRLTQSRDLILKRLQAGVDLRLRKAVELLELIPDGVEAVRRKRNAAGADASG